MVIGTKITETNRASAVEKETQSSFGSSPQAGGPKQLKFEFHLGVQEQHRLKMMPGSHKESVSDVLDMHGKLRR